jgi:plastocyanin
LRPRTLIGAGCAALLFAPALAIGQAPGITAVGTTWRATPGSGSTLMVTVGATVTFSNPGTQDHYVKFTGGPAPSCTAGVPTSYKVGAWSGECTFPTAGVYEFVCPLHDAPPDFNMSGTIRVVVPTPTPTPTPDPDPSATPSPGATPTPAPTSVPTSQTQSSLKLRLASGQRGTRVRGQVDVLHAASRLEVTLRARLSRARVRAGRTVRASTAAGAVAFSVPLNAKAKRVLRSRKRLTVTVAVALTPPGAKTITRSQKVKLRR